MPEYQRMSYFILPLWCISGFSRQRAQSDFLLIPHLEESAILCHPSCRCYGTPTEVFITQQGHHLSTLVISEYRQAGIFWVLEAFSTAAWRTRMSQKCSGVWPHVGRWGLHASVLVCRTDLWREIEMLLQLRLLAKPGLGCARIIALWFTVTTNGREEIRMYISSVLHGFVIL